MKDTVIKVLNEEHGKKVIEYFKSKGVDTGGIDVLDTVENKGGFCYYGVLDGDFDNFSHIHIAHYHPNADIIELPKENEYPKVMLVRGYAGQEWNKRVVFMEKNGFYIGWKNARTLKEAEETVFVDLWNEAKDLTPKRKVTKSELAELLGTDNYEIVD